MLGQVVEGFLPRSRGFGLVAHALEQAAESVTQGFLVVDDQNAGAGKGCLAL
jgi:hypothetical protein